MRYIFLIICFCTSGLSASSQWYRIDLKLIKHERFPLIEQSDDHSILRLSCTNLIKPVIIHSLHLDRSEYSYQAAENLVMRTAQHNMRFREYDNASYNFSELARLYIRQNRFSEAKWYLLQSNLIARERNDNKLTILNLIDLSTIKADIGEYIMAQQDLMEAYTIAGLKGFKDDLLIIERKILNLKEYKLSAPKSELRYAEAPQTVSKSE